MNGENGAERYAVINGWLVENVGHHTCGAGTAETGYAHEPGCGWEPIARVEQLLAEPGPAVPPHTIDRDMLHAVLHGWSPPAMWPFNDALADAIIALVRPVEGPGAREIADWFEREAEPGDPTDWRLRTARTIRHQWALS